MNKPLIATGLILSISVLSSGQVQASPFSIQQDNILQIIKPVKVKPKPDKQVKVVNGDTLDKIAKQNHTSVERLFAKNKSIKNPDNLKVGQVLTIPQATERLSKRLYKPDVKIYPTASKSQPAPAGAVSGNGYFAGYCTAYAKDRRPDIPNNLGNADTWYVNALAQGLAGGPVPRVNAVAVAKGYMHVAIVEQIKGNQIYISEMNYQGFGVISSRWTNANEWNYIY